MVRNWDLLKGRHFLKLLDYTPEEIEYLLDLAADLKERKKKGIRVDYLASKNIVLIFEKTSTRTRCAFEVAAHDLGMGTTYLDPKSSQMGKKESIEDTAKVLGGMFEGIEYRGFAQETVEALAYFSTDVNITFYEKLLGKQVADAPDDKKMLDLVWDTICPEFAQAYDDVSGGWLYMVPELTWVNTTQNLASYVRGKENSAKKTLNKFLTLVIKMNERNN